MTTHFRIDGQVPFEDVEKLFGDDETRVNEGISNEDFDKALSLWALSRFGKHLNVCVRAQMVSGNDGCVCGLDWTKKQLEIK